MTEVYVGNLGWNITTVDISNNFQRFGEIRKIKLPRTKARGYAFVEFKNHGDALFAVQSWNGKYNWHVELSRNAAMQLWAGGAGSSSSSFRQSSRTNNCYRCGGYGHFARNCTSRYGKDMKKKGVKQSQRGRMKKNQIASKTIWKPISPPPPLLELPEDITMTILKKLGAIEILMTAQNVCKAWRKICRDPTMWCVIDMKLCDVEEERYWNYDLHRICRYAVDLSQGQVTEININFGPDSDEHFGDILDYIAKRCGNLRCLSIIYSGIVRYHNIYIESLKKAVMGFPLLEELHLHLVCGAVKMDDIEAISKSCPMLKTFALNTGYVQKYDGFWRGKEEALAVATFMPELRRLQLFRNLMSNEGLENILNCCTKLVSLDLRRCYNLDLGAELKKRCDRQIKILRLPHDPIHDFASDVNDSGLCYNSWDDSYSDYRSDEGSYDWSNDESYNWSDDKSDDYYGLGWLGL